MLSFICVFSLAAFEACELVLSNNDSALTVDCTVRCGVFVFGAVNLESVFPL